MRSDLPADEAARLQALQELDVLDSAPDARLERIVQLAANVLETPIALISLVDAERQWFKARIGIDAAETPRDIAFCSHTILSDAPLIVRDTLEDARFSDNPLVAGEPNIRFYAGAPLILNSGHRIGTLCAVDMKPRQPTEAQIRTLQSLAAVIVDALTTRHEMRQMQQNLAAQTSRERLENLHFSDLGQEIRDSLDEIIGFASIIENETLGALDNPKYRDYAATIRKSANLLVQAIYGAPAPGAVGKQERRRD